MLKASDKNENNKQQIFDQQYYRQNIYNILVIPLCDSLNYNICAQLIIILHSLINKKQQKVNRLER